MIRLLKPTEIRHVPIIGLSTNSLNAVRENQARHLELGL